MASWLFTLVIRGKWLRGVGVFGLLSDLSSMPLSQTMGGLYNFQSCTALHSQGECIVGAQSMHSCLQQLKCTNIGIWNIISKLGNKVQSYTTPTHATCVATLTALWLKCAKISAFCHWYIHSSIYGPIFCSVHCRQEILQICELMKLRIFDTETNRIQSRIYYDPANIRIMPENIEINISEIDS